MTNAADDAVYEADTGEDLPWLEPDELEYEEAGGGIGQRTILIVAVTLVAVIAALWWFADRYGGDEIEVPDGEVPLVEAPDGPFKIRPDDPGGLQVSEDERMTNEVAAGGELPSEVDTARVPEVPIVPPVDEGGPPPRDLLAETSPGAAEPEDLPVRGETPVEVERPLDAPTASPPASAETSLIQLGAFSTSSKATEVWSTFRSRYSYLQPLELALERVEVNGSTLVRLRAKVPGSRAAATDICNRLKLAGEQCVVV